MKREFTKLMAALVLLLFMAPCLVGWGQTTTTYVFTSKEWKATVGETEANWTCGKAGNELTNGQGIQVTTSVSGANGTSPISFTNVTQIIVKYCTNASKGAGTIKVQVGSGTEQSFSVTKPSSGGTTLKDATFNFNSPESGSVKVTGECTTNSVYIYSVAITTASSYTITAESNNSAYGTVTLSGSTITATPATGYRVSTTTPYTVTSGTATVTQNGNTFSVAAESDCTVTINFEAIPTHAATFSVNGATNSTQVAEGAAITFPADPANIDEMVFMGWTNAAINGTQSEAPTFVTSATMGTSDVTFYAVFASVTPGTATTVTDELTRETTGVTSGTTTYSSWSGKTSNSDAVYAGNSAGGNNSIQLRTNNSNSGVVTTTSGGKAKKVTITWNSNTTSGRVLDIYGKNSAYSAASELYNTNNQGTKLGSVTYGGNSTVVTITDDYNFIGMRSNDGAMYISSISIEWESVSPDTYSDYCTTVIIPAVAKPTFSLASGEVLDGTVVTMSCTTEGATIYYSTDDGATWAEGNTYTVTENVTLKAKAVKDSAESQVVEATYTVQYILTVNMEHVEYFIFNYHDEDWYDFPVDAEGRPLVHAGDNVRVSVASVEDCYTLQGLSVTYGENTIVPEYLSETGEYSFIMPASSATLSASVTTYEVALFTYTKVTSVTPGKHYIIVTASDDNQGKYHAMGGNNSTGSNPYMNPVEVNVDNNTVTVAENEGVAEILIDLTGSKYTLHTSEGYLAGGDKKLDINGTVESTWGISFDDDQAVITWTSGNTNYAIQYNPSNPRFACYSSSQTKVCLYEKNETTYELAIQPYSVAQGTTDNPTDGWYLISSPVIEDITPDEYNGFLTNTYDLYRFNQNPTIVDGVGKEWENYKNYHFSIKSGKGYLYANSNQTTLKFTGTPNSKQSQTVKLDYTNGAQLAGVNLVGNPFPVNATSSLSYYVMNSTRTGIDPNATSANTAIPSYTGIIVMATEANQTVTFTRQTRSSAGATDNKGYVNLVLSQQGNRGMATLDKAIVSFNEGDQLGKFYFGTQNANLYIPQGTEEYAIVSSEAQGEKPINFRANEDGQYTLTVNPENVDMKYLHLIDNMTGMDVDLLQTPSYTFNATTRDYESRFRLVFAANNEDGVSTGSTAFAFYSNGNWIINNAGEATLQVIDLTGRILSSETVSGSVSKTINATPGVYMLRLINGDNVNVQKIVVR